MPLNNKVKNGRGDIKMKTKIYVNGTVVTADAKSSVCEAIAVAGKKVVGVGTNAKMLEQFGQDAEVIDLEEKTILPGFYDGHSHVHQVALYSHFVNLEAPPVGTVDTIEKCLTLLRERAAITPPGAWIYASGFTENGVKEKRGLLRKELDEISSTNPIYILDKTLHYLYVNSVTLERAGINADTPDPVGGVIWREEDGKTPNGILEEEAARNVTNMLTAGKLGDIGTVRDPVAKIEAATLKYAACGVTTANDGGTMLKDIPTYQKGAAEGRLHTRVVFNPFYPYRTVSGAEYLDQVDAFDLDPEWLHMGGIKLMYDGTIQNMSAYLSKPYYTPYKGDASYCGYPSLTKEKLMGDFTFIHERGKQILIHCNGDAGMDDILDGYKELQEKYPLPDIRHNIIHAQTIREDQINRAKDQGVFLSLFPPHIFYYGDRHKYTFLGPERAERLSPAASLVKRGMPFSIHCDTPVFPQNPLQTIWTAVNRVTYEGQVLGEAQRISVMDAIKAYTIHAAYQHHEEKERGSLEAGKYADIVILAENPLTCDPMKIRDIKVLETLINGETAYKAE